MPSIYIEGNIGSGKSTVLRALAQRNLATYPEPVHKWTDVGGQDLLASFYANQSRYAFLLQVRVIQTLVRRQREAKQGLVLFERSLLSSKYIFFAGGKKAGLYTAAEELILEDLYHLFESEVKPSLLVYLEAPTELLLARINKRRRDGEEQITREYICSLNQLHGEWLAATPYPVLKVDAVLSPEEISEQICSKICDW